MHRHIYNNSEKICKHILESIFSNYRFVKAKPSWLTNPLTGGGRNWIFIILLYLAVEYNGRYHYNNTNKENP